MNETPVTIVGTVVKDLRGRRVGDDGATVVNFRIAANERRFDKETGQWGDGDSLYITVTCWRRLAENVLASLVKGDPVVVTGKLRTRDFEGKDGESRSVTEMEASAVGADLARCTTTVRRNRRTEAPADGSVADDSVAGGSVAGCLPEVPPAPSDEELAGTERLGELADAARPLVPAMA